ncbi:MAG: hypothetical protein KKF89_04010 [Nanoarchaeota archaeon]|nr:hypothetical protein [Nanoarchaeota archaeon]MBU1854860.1 hypothetical protein [Nanoarchaeota archaeon]
MKFIIPVLVFILIIGFVAAEVPPPPAPPPNLGGSRDLPDEPADDEYDNETTDLPPPPAMPDFQLDEEPEEYYEDEVNENTSVVEEKQGCPVLECPSPSNTLNYILIFLVAVLLGVVGFLMLQKKSITPKYVEKQPVKEVNNDEEILEKLRTYVKKCQFQGFMDEDIRLELMKSGYSIDMINKLF